MNDAVIEARFSSNDVARLKMEVASALSAAVLLCSTVVWASNFQRVNNPQNITSEIEIACKQVQSDLF